MDPVSRGLSCFRGGSRLFNASAKDPRKHGTHLLSSPVRSRLRLAAKRASDSYSFFRHIARRAAKALRGPPHARRAALRRYHNNRRMGPEGGSG